MMIFVLNRERRRLGKAFPDFDAERRDYKGISTRYQVIVNDPDLERILKTEYGKEPDAVFPHESGEKFIFYCIVSGVDNIEEENFIKDLFSRIRRNRVHDLPLEKIEIHRCEYGDKAVKAFSYKLKDDNVERSQLW